VKPDESELTPLRPRDFFAVPWSGEGEWIAARWLHALARRPRRFSFTTSTTWLSDDVWIVHDAFTWENGRAEHRSGVARLTAADRISLSYSDMPGGTEIELGPDGFRFARYRIRVTLVPLPFAVLVSADDACQWSAADQELTDTIRLHLFGVPLGEMVMRLRPGAIDAPSQLEQS
jgi:hypothetical protein